MHLICRILVVKQKGKVLSPLNATLVDVVVRSLLPSSPTQLSASEVSHAIEEHLQTKEDDVWIGWTVKTPTREERERGWVCSVVSLFLMRAGWRESTPGLGKAAPGADDDSSWVSCSPV